MSSYVRKKRKKRKKEDASYPDLDPSEAIADAVVTTMRAPIQGLAGAPLLPVGDEEINHLCVSPRRRPIHGVRTVFQHKINRTARQKKQILDETCFQANKFQRGIYWQQKRLENFGLHAFKRTVLRGESESTATTSSSNNNNGNK